MDNFVHLNYAVADRSYLAILKKEIHSLAHRTGFQGAALAEIDIITAEITSNLVKHARHGELLVRTVSQNGTAGIEFLSIDSGPGISETAIAMKDGVSTKGTLGQGLGAIKRLSDVFQLYSIPAWGSILLSRRFLKPLSAHAPEPAEVRFINVPKPSESVSGDGIFYYLTPEYLKVISLDGLGHGPDAHAASQKAIDEFRNCPLTNAVDIIRYIHPLIKRTRGAVGSVGIFSFAEKRWNICGVGNISTRIQNGLVAKNYMPYNGIIGLTMPSTMKENLVDHTAGQLLVMMSDGIRTKLELSKYPGILKYDLSILAAAIYKDHARKTDDMSVVISKINL